MSLHPFQAKSNFAILTVDNVYTELRAAAFQLHNFFNSLTADERSPRGNQSTDVGLMMREKLISAPPSAGVPWYVWACLIATTSGGIGSIWDISWHKSIGRDSFWTPA